MVVVFLEAIDSVTAASTSRMTNDQINRVSRTATHSGSIDNQTDALREAAPIRSADIAGGVRRCLRYFGCGGDSPPWLGVTIPPPWRR
jgi:hypothetical protein